MVSFDKRSIRSWSLLGIAPSIFINSVSEVMKNNDNVFLMTADTGRYCGFQKLDESLNDRIINVGIAEQNMLGIAAGLALEGKMVYATTYAPFIVFRCADHMRHLVGNCNLNIKLIGTAAGFTAANSGSALLAINDLAFARSIPNMTVLSPADCAEAMKMILAVSSIEGPVYMRFCGLSNLPIVYGEDFDYEIGKPNILVDGQEIAVLATGTTIVSEAQKASRIINETTGIQPTVVDFHTIKPLNEPFLSQLFEEYKLIVTVEEHSIIGGLGSAVAETIARKECKGVKLLSIGVGDKIYKSGDRNYMLEQCGITAEKIANKIIEELSKG